jgi:hypothetical protein
MNHRTPSPIAIRLLESVLSETVRDAIVGDLIEESALRAGASNRVTATWWCWWQVARSILPMLWSELRHRRSLGTLSVALAAYLLASVIEFLSTAAISNLFHPDAALAYILGAIVGLATMVLGGYAVQLPLGSRDFWRLPANDTLLAIKYPQIATLVGEATKVGLRQEVMELRLVRQRREPAPLSQRRCNFSKHLGTYGTAHAARLRPSICLNHPSSWFQLAKMRLTSPRCARTG